LREWTITFKHKIYIALFIADVQVKHMAKKKYNQSSEYPDLEARFLMAKLVVKNHGMDQLVFTVLMRDFGYSTCGTEKLLNDPRPTKWFEVKDDVVELTAQGWKAFWSMLESHYWDESWKRMVNEVHAGSDEQPKSSSRGTN